MLLVAALPTLTRGELGTVLIELFCLLGAAYWVIRIWHLVRRQPPIEAVFASKRDLERCQEAWRKEAVGGVQKDVFSEFRRDMREAIQALRAKMEADKEQVLTKIDEMRIEMQQTSDRRAVAVHNRINDLQDRTARLMAKVGS